MSRIKYGVWFHGNELEPESICYFAREPYIVEDRELALQHKKYLQDGVSSLEQHLFSVCEIHISNNLLRTNHGRENQRFERYGTVHPL